MIIKKYIIVLSFFTFLLNVFGFSHAFSQRLITNDKDTISSVIVDTAVLVIAKRGLTAEDFIRQILQDTGFYQAFRNLKLFSLISSENIKTYDNKGNTESHIQRKILHDNSGLVYKQKILSDIDSGKVYRQNGKYRLYTLQMFNYIFENDKNSDLTEGSSSKSSSESSNSGGNEGYKQKLKKLIFQPGTPIDGIPFISQKTKIFSPEMRDYYNYTYASATYYGNTPVYRFTVSAKPQYRDDGSIMIKDLITIFDKKNFNILGRYINMQYNNILFSFDVRMNIETQYFGDLQLPVLIQYAGNWDIPFKKKEIAAFAVRMSEVKVKGLPLDSLK